MAGSPASPGGQDAVIRLRFDTKGAFGDLDSLDRRIEQSSRAAVRVGGMGGGGGGMGMGGGALGMALSAAMNAGLGQLSLAGIGAMVGAPIASDAMAIANNGFGGLGKMISQWSGLSAGVGMVDASQQAQRDTVAAFGIAGASASESSVQSVFRSFERIRRQEQAGRVAVEKATQGMVAEASADAFLTVLKEIRDKLTPANPNTMATGGKGATPGAGGH